MILEKRLIVALDVPSLDKASKLVIQLGESVVYYKVGMELFYGAGPEIIQYLKSYGKNIFLDLKLHDIPNTVGSSAAVLASLGVDMLNVHATGGRAMMANAARMAREAAQKSGRKPPQMVAVTVLTSMGAEDWRELNSKLTIDQQVIELAKLAKDSGMDGIVASAQEAAGIRAACGTDFLIVTPGVRMATDDLNDQNRIATPKAALLAGATHLVVGRPITQADDPKAAARAVIENMREAGK